MVIFKFGEEMFQKLLHDSAVADILVKIKIAYNDSRVHLHENWFKYFGWLGKIIINVSYGSAYLYRDANKQR